MEKNFLSAKVLSSDYAFSYSIERDLRGATLRATMFAGLDLLVTVAIFVFRGYMFEFFNPLDMVDSTGRHPKSLLVMS